MTGSLWRMRVARLIRNRFGLTMVALSVVILGIAFAAPVIAPYDPLAVHSTQQLLPPSREHLFGTDSLGRDVFSRVVYGSRISIRIAVIVVALSVTIGTAVGSIAAYRGGRLDDLIMRVTDIFLAFPFLILAMALSAALGPSVNNAAIALGLVWWPGYARLIRGQILTIKTATYVQASHATGASPVRTLVRHIIPNAIDPVLVRMVLTGGNAILASAALSFVGVGAQPPDPEWGLMVAIGRQYMGQAWWYPTLVGSAIFVTVLVFTLAGDAIKGAMFREDV